MGTVPFGIRANKPDPQKVEERVRARHHAGRLKIQYGFDDQLPMTEPTTQKEKDDWITPKMHILY